MAKQLVEFTLEDNSSILVEVDEPKTTGPKPVARPDEVAIQAQQTFEKAWERLQPMVTSIKNKMDAMNTPADEVEVKFGVKLSGQVGAIVTAGAEAQYEITLKWNK